MLFLRDTFGFQDFILESLFTFHTRVLGGWKDNNTIENLTITNVNVLLIILYVYFKKQRDKKEEDNHHHHNNIGTGFEIKMLKYKSNGTIIFGTHTPFVRCWDYKLTNHQILHYVQARKLYHLRIFGIFLWIPYTLLKSNTFLKSKKDYFNEVLI